MEEEIKSNFEESGFVFAVDEVETLHKCLNFCINFNLNPSDLVSSWEVYYLNRQLNESVIRNAEMNGFLLHLQNEVREAAIKEEPNLHIYSEKDIDMILNGEDEHVKEEVIGTPPARADETHSEALDYVKNTGNGFSSEKISRVATPFGQRTEKFVIRSSINQQPKEEKQDMECDDNFEDDIIKRARPHRRCSLVVHSTKPELSCRFMFDKVEDRFNVLERRIKDYSLALQASSFYEEPMDPAVASQKSVFTVGMICCDGEGHLNDKSILLQSSVEHSGGQRVRLDLHKMEHFSVFPGQIVGIEGNNPSGHCLIASKIVECLPTNSFAEESPRPSKKKAMHPEDLSTDPCSSQQLSMIIATGPFSTTDNLFFEPLTELLAYAKRKTPQLLVLLGPFLDSEHPLIKKGSTDRSFEEIFRVEILQKLRDYVEYQGDASQIVLLPSVRDSHHDFVFPQPGFAIPPDLKYQVASLTNPGMMEANEVQIGCCTVDILKHLSGEEMSRNPTDGIPSDRMSRLAYHVLSQRSFYPLYPPPESVPLDLSLAPETLRLSSIPDILVLPSDMKPFLKVVSLRGGEEPVSCLCVNPGRLAKGESGGTFVELHYHGSPSTAIASIISI
ncbi:hypothetical protein MLD38_017037 [Melastoma candidum]|uniref:Uncharacterized protein n=1 Tax=Melastoma candidum TaxID=119954 RepID=A0ACB9QQH9_9MYRT|nr:hypothetical protein MLD38_017037 [Melastoma candidum]